MLPGALARLAGEAGRRRVRDDRGMHGSGPPSPLVVSLIGGFSLLLAWILSLGLPSLGALMATPMVVAAAGGLYAFSLVPGALREDKLAAGPWAPPSTRQDAPARAHRASSSSPSTSASSSRARLMWS